MFYYPTTLIALLSRAIDSLPTYRAGPHGGGGVSLPIFSPAWTHLEALASLLRGKLGAYAARFELVQLARSRFEARASFRLPLRISIDAALRPLIAPLESDPTFRGPDVEHHGVQFREFYPQQLSEVLAEGVDILICESGVAASLDGRAMPEEACPRLVIAVDTGPWPAPPKRGALIYMSGIGSDAPGFVQRIVYGIIHDLPLHEAFASALKAPDNRSYSLGAFLPMLWADPATNNGLRMAHAYVDLMTRALDVGHDATPGSPDFEHRVKTRDRLSASLGSSRTARRPIDLLAKNAADLMPNFQREGTGFLPLAALTADVQRAAAAAIESERWLRELAGDKESIETLAAHQVRRADLRVERLEFSPLALQASSPQEIMWVGNDVALRRGARYRLRVQIGNPLPSSLLVRPAPPLDPLLPADPNQKDGHTIEVALFPLDFAADGSLVKKVLLPRLGATKPVLFEIRAPTRVGRARLRVCLYHDNNLVQAFKLWATVLDEEQKIAPNDLLAELEFSQTSRYANIETLAPRALAIATNAIEGQHTFHLKRGEASGAINVSEDVIQSTISDFRKTLHDAVSRDGWVLFLPDGDPSAPPSEAFKSVVRALAKHGHGLFRAVFDRARSFQGELRALRAQSGQTIQIVRFDPTFAFPWNIIYDFADPSQTGTEELPVCHGFSSEGGKATPCAHDAVSTGVVCVRGFWSVRHRIEQLVEASGHEPAPVLSRRGAVRLGIDEHTIGRELYEGLEEKLRALSASAYSRIADSTGVLDAMWNAESTEVVVLGHCEGDSIRIGDSTLLRSSDITKRNIERSAPRPGPLVLMMGCGTGAVDVSTLNGFMTALSGAGFPAVVGTESLVVAGLGSRFVRDLNDALFSGATLGEAIRRFRLELFRRGNPHGVTFTALGNADLVIEKE
jgi:hypothetical protein